jgi:ABC-type glycerol-3-phosphate transport system permease component
MVRLWRILVELTLDPFCRAVVWSSSPSAAVVAAVLILPFEFSLDLFRCAFEVSENQWATYLINCIIKKM